jgi:hypothetical protein
MRSSHRSQRSLEKPSQLEGILLSSEFKFEVEGFYLSPSSLLHREQLPNQMSHQVQQERDPDLRQIIHSSQKSDSVGTQSVPQSKTEAQALSMAPAVLPEPSMESESINKLESAIPSHKLIFEEDMADPSCLQSRLPNPVSDEAVATKSTASCADFPSSGLAHDPPSPPPALPDKESGAAASATNSTVPTSLVPPAVILPARPENSLGTKKGTPSPPVLVAANPWSATPRKRSSSDSAPDPATNTKKVKATSPRHATPPKKRSASEDDEEEESEDDDDDGWNYFSVLYPTDVLPAKYFHLRSFLGRKFTDLEVRKNDPFKYGCVTDIVQLDGKGPFLFKFYNYFKFPKKAPPENEDDWAYQGCEELIADSENKKNPTYLWQ